MKIATSRTREQFPLSRKKIMKKSLPLTLLWSVCALGLTIGLITPIVSFETWKAGKGGSAVLIFAIAVVSSVLFFAITFAYQSWYYAVYFYELDDNYIVIRKGPITPREITIPYERVQDIHMDQDLLDRLFGLYDVHLSSATISSGMEAHIDGVEREAAEGLRELILRKVNAKISSASNG